MKNSLLNLKGSIVAIVTPFNADNSIDYSSYENLLKFHLENGTNGIVVCGTTGETPTLTDKEYTELIRFTIQKINHRIPVIAGSGSNSTDKTLYYSQIAMNQGVDGLLIVNPYYNKPTQEGIYKHFAFLAENINLPIILYNVPGRTGSNMSAELILRLAKDYKNIVAVKEASGNLIQIMEILANRPKGFNVYSGDDNLALPIIALGGEGCISVVGNEIPKAFSQLIQFALEGNLIEARKMHNQYLNLMSLNFVESNPVPVKTALALMGLMKENVRLPLCEMERKNKETLKTELQKLLLIKENILIPTN